MPRLSISSWSLHRTLGKPWYRPAADGSDLLTTDAPATGLPLLDLPAQVAAHGIGTLELCHFHLPRTDAGYLADLRAALDAAGLELFSILIDGGDITAADEAKRRRDVAWVRGWIEVAGRLGAGHARVVAGEAEPSDAAVALSARHLRDLAAFGRGRGVRVITENFKALTRRADTTLAILDQCEGEVGLCCDFGNASGPHKYDDLAALLPRADSVHAKARYAESGAIDAAELARCLDLSRAAGFDGPYSLIFDSPGDEWENVDRLRQIVSSYV